jgi:RNA-binding protein
MLSNVGKRYLRGLGHHLDAIVQIGKDGADAGVVKATAEALLRHELIKVKINQNAGEEREELIDTLASRTGSEIVQTIGRVALLYREHPEEPQIEIPDSPQKLRRLQRKPRRGPNV